MLKDHIRSQDYINQLDQLAKTLSGAILWMLSVVADHLMEVF